MKTHSSQKKKKKKENKPQPCLCSEHQWMASQHSFSSHFLLTNSPCLYLCFSILRFRTCVLKSVGAMESFPQATVISLEQTYDLNQSNPCEFQDFCLQCWFKVAGSSSRTLRLLLLPWAEDRMKVRPPIQRRAQLKESYRNFPGGLVAKILHS